MSVMINGLHKPMYHRKAVASLNQIPVLNTWYTILDTTKHVVIYQINARQVNDEAGAKNVEIRLTQNYGKDTITGAGSHVSGTEYYWYVYYPTDAMLSSTTAYSAGPLNTSLFVGTTKVEVRIATATGSTQVLYGDVFYGIVEEAV